MPNKNIRLDEIVVTAPYNRAALWDMTSDYATYQLNEFFDKLMNKYRKKRQNQVVKFQDGGDVKNAGMLQEVVVKPDKQSRRSLGRLQRMLRKADRSRFLRNFYTANNVPYYENVSENQYIDKMYDLWERSGKPIFDFSMSDDEFKNNGGWNYRSHHRYNNRLKKSIISPSIDDEDLKYTNRDHILEEMSHAYQHGNDGRIYIGSRVNNGYDVHGSKEYNAHTVIQPVMEQYIASPSMDYNQFRTILKNRYNDLNYADLRNILYTGNSDRDKYRLFSIYDTARRQLDRYKHSPLNEFQLMLLREAEKNGVFNGPLDIPESRYLNPRAIYKNGGTIHINPTNRGKFNATKKRTGKTTEELTHSKNPLTRKRAIFAQNAKKWNH